MTLEFELVARKDRNIPRILRELAGDSLVPIEAMDLRLRSPIAVADYEILRLRLSISPSMGLPMHSSKDLNTSLRQKHLESTIETPTSLILSHQKIRIFRSYSMRKPFLISSISALH
ncbi:hypothetical protein BCY86_00985 [Pajaroellobacter abortibovis]|uniref:Uncharacterized protein n=1 Tax=Pajaroellobacter abortibovis TaxID=1882918 RepID=A0A1L6MVA7_9BACT|nr:hypothetical protein BCY86_00985 [Pajaroellobacter abortibovis]